MTVVNARRKRVLLWLLGIFVSFVVIVGLVWNTSKLGQAPRMLEKELILAERDGLPISVEQLRLRIGVSPSENAGPDLKLAFSAIKKWKETNEGKSILKVTGSFQAVGTLKDLDIEKIGPAVSTHQEIFSILEKAARKPKVDFEVDYGRGGSTTYPELEQERAGVALLVIRARYEHQQGKAPQAMATLDLAAKVSRLVSEDPSIIGLFIGASTRSLVCDTVALMLKAYGERPEVRGLARNVLLDLGEAPDLAPALMSDFVMARITIGQLRNSRIGADAFGSETNTRMIALAKFGPIGTAYELRFVQTFRHMFEAITQNRKSFLKTHKALIDAQYEMDINAKHDWTYTLTELMSPIFEGIPMTIGEGEAKRRVLLAAIDLIELRSMRESSRLRGAPWRFTPGNQPYWVDPFTEKPLKIHAKKDGFVVYSVGRDEKDDGGKQRPPKTFYQGYDLPFSYPE